MCVCLFVVCSCIVSAGPFLHSHTHRHTHIETHQNTHIVTLPNTYRHTHTHTITHTHTHTVYMSVVCGCTCPRQEAAARQAAIAARQCGVCLARQVSPVCARARLFLQSGGGGGARRDVGGARAFIISRRRGEKVLVAERKEREICFDLCRVLFFEDRVNARSRSPVQTFCARARACVCVCVCGRALCWSAAAAAAGGGDVNQLFGRKVKGRDGDERERERERDR